MLRPCSRGEGHSRHDQDHCHEHVGACGVAHCNDGRAVGLRLSEHVARTVRMRAPEALGRSRMRVASLHNVWRVHVRREKGSDVCLRCQGTPAEVHRVAEVR